MRIDKFYKNSFIMMLSNLITGVISFVFSIMLSRELGTEGLGLYGLVMPIYFLLLCFICEGLVTAVSTVSALYYGKHDIVNLNKTVKTVFSFISVWGIFVAFLAFTNSSYISSSIIKDPRSLNGLRAICPALLFVSFSAILKGYFYGIGRFKVPAFVDVFEKALRIVVLAGIVAVLPFKDEKSTVGAACAALSAGEFASFIILYLFYRKNSRSEYGAIVTKPESSIQLLFDVLVISLPLCLNGILSTSLSAVSTLILPQRLVSAGIPYCSALSLIGEFTRMAMNIPFFPIVMVNSISAVLIPDLSYNLKRKNYWAIENRIFQALRLSCLAGITTLVVCLCIPDALGALFYNRADLGPFIRFAAISSLIGFLSYPTFGILNGLGKQKILLKNSLIVSAQELLLIYLLTGIPSINIYGLGITQVITSATSLMLNYGEIKKVCYIRPPVTAITRYLISGALTYIILMILNNTLPPSLLILRTSAIAISGFILVVSLTKLLEQIFPCEG